MAKKALGKGLGALISGAGRSKKSASPPKSASSSKAAKKGGAQPGRGKAPSSPRKSGKAAASALKVDPTTIVHQIGIAKIVPSPLQPRGQFKEEQLNELVASIREHGVIQPLVVRKVGGKFELIAGERRWRAATLLELKEVPAILRKASDRDVLEMALIENLQREDLNALEEARAYQRLSKEFGMTQEEIAGRVGKNRATIANAIRLLDLSKDVQNLVGQNLITTGHAKVLLSLKEKSAQALIAEIVVKRGLTVRQTEKAVAEHQAGGAGNTRGGESRRDVMTAVGSVQSNLRDHFATHVKVVHGEKKGKIEIEYYGNDDLDRILNLMGINQLPDVHTPAAIEVPPTQAVPPPEIPSIESPPTTPPTMFPED